jgi:hypothetical protein
MADPLVIRIGPIKTPSSEELFLYAPLSRHIVPDQVLFAGDDKSGLEMMQKQLGGRAFRCEPLLAEAAQEIGLPIAELDTEMLELRADVALSLRELEGFPPTDPIDHRRFLLRGLGALRNGPVWARLDSGSTAFGRVDGVVGKAPCDADISVSFGFVPSQHLHIVMDPDAPADGAAKYDVRIALRNSPAYLLEPLGRAYALDCVPSLIVNDTPPDVEWLTRWAAPMGASLYALGIMRANELRKSLTLDDPVGLHISCSMEISSSA